VSGSVNKWNEWSGVGVLPTWGLSAKKVWSSEEAKNKGGGGVAGRVE